MVFLKSLLIKILNLATHPGMDENKKLAIQVATFDAVVTLFIGTFYLIDAWLNNLDPLTFIYLVGASLYGLAIYLLYKRHYDAGRILGFFVSLVEIFISVDSSSVQSGFEYFYFTSLAIPFVAFSFDERLKGGMLTSIGATVLIIQQVIGTGLFFPINEPGEWDRVITMSIVVIYHLAVFTVARWQLAVA